MILQNEKSFVSSFQQRCMEEAMSHSESWQPLTSCQPDEDTLQAKSLTKLQPHSRAALSTSKHAVV